MKHKIKTTLSRLFSNNWLITLTATLIGVFVALYMNKIVSSKKLENQKTIATKNILSEIKQNQESLEKNIKNQEVLLGTIQFIKTHMDSENRVISSVDSMNIFRKKYPKTFTVQDSVKLENGKYHYTGEMDMNFGVSYINLTNVAWETLKNSGLSSSYDFNCLMFLEKMNKVTMDILVKDKEFLELLGNYQENENYYDKVILKASQLIEYEKGLLNGYKSSPEQLKKCT
ncbi:hypothetical protein ACFSQJ_14390 [Croceitalea marina]|uniref:Uncharacterized protein n=1 Tax=Croceitalea marina TaxID=1775166 RepID=A0ABW5MYP1_9FLAO